LIAQFAPVRLSLSNSRAIEMLKKWNDDAA
jgi:hypothetical protein